MQAKDLLWQRFTRSCQQFADRPAISVAGQETTYAYLANKAKGLAATIQRESDRGAVPLTAVFAYRSETAYAAVLGALMAGHGYVPLNRTFPVERTRLMLERSMCRCVIVDAGSAPQLAKVLLNLGTQVILICPDHDDVTELAAKFPEHRFVGMNEIDPPEKWCAPAVPSDAIAYLLFTSGSTGQPKGVMVSNSNVAHYVDYVSKRYCYDCNDRVSQTFDLTFDLSAHDMFVGWQNGACVCCLSQKQLIKPGAFINDSKLTAWFSVPSTAVFMRRLGVLKPGMYPGLRLTLFCGEALPVEVARDWAMAAPNSIIENIYGPTELTIACTAYRWDSAVSPVESEHGVVPIGEPFDDMELLIVDQQLREVEDGVDGELVMTGPQLSLGYWQDSKRTEKAFIPIPDKNGTYYKTGDRVRRGGRGKPLVYLGRLDNQVKILGHRVELGEVEAAVRDVAGAAGVVALGWPKTESGADGIEVFIEANQLDTQPLMNELKAKLPIYMVPRTIRVIDRIPLNTNGKYDRRALEALLAAI
jgi:amino acid adenylation domain-containing protein